MKCANCVNDAEYTDAPKNVNPVNYCGICLPVSLRVEAHQGLLPLIEDDPKPKKD